MARRCFLLLYNRTIMRWTSIFSPTCSYLADAPSFSLSLSLMSWNFWTQHCWLSRKPTRAHTMHEHTWQQTMSSHTKETQECIPSTQLGAGVLATERQRQRHISPINKPKKASLWGLFFCSCSFAALAEVLTVHGLVHWPLNALSSKTAPKHNVPPPCLTVGTVLFGSSSFLFLQTWQVELILVPPKPSLNLQDFNPVMFHQLCSRWPWPRLPSHH